MPGFLLIIASPDKAEPINRATTQPHCFRGIRISLIDICVYDAYKNNIAIVISEYVSYAVIVEIYI